MNKSDNILVNKVKPLLTLFNVSFHKTTFEKHSFLCKHIIGYTILTIQSIILYIYMHLYFLILYIINFNF
jgi:hypothetical protein